MLVYCYLFRVSDTHILIFVENGRKVDLSTSFSKSKVDMICPHPFQKPVREPCSKVRTFSHVYKIPNGSKKETQTYKPIYRRFWSQQNCVNLVMQSSHLPQRSDFGQTLAIPSILKLKNIGIIRLHPIRTMLFRLALAKWSNY